MSKMHYFSNKLSTINRRAMEALRPPAMIVTWSCVIWPNLCFSNWLWRNRTLKNQLWRHIRDVIHFFSFWALSQIKFFGHAYALTISNWAPKRVHLNSTKRNVKYFERW